MRRLTQLLSLARPERRATKPRPRTFGASAYHRRLFCEALEDRRLLSVTPQDVALLDDAVAQAAASDELFSVQGLEGMPRLYLDSTPNVADARYYDLPNNRLAAAANVGQCTWYVYGRIQETGLMTAQQLSSLPIFRGNADTWYSDAISARGVAAGITTGSEPRPGAIAYWNSAKHVAFVEDSSGNVTESNNRPAEGSQVVINGYLGHPYVKLRQLPDASSPTVWEVPQFTVMNVTGPPQTANGYRWFPLSADDGNPSHTGWAELLDANSGVPTADNFIWNFTVIKLAPSSPWRGEPDGYIYLPSSPRDPELDWSTYLGGSSNDGGSGVTVDDAGNVYVTGHTLSWGWVSGAFDTSNNGQSDAFVVKLSPTGEHLWSTYLGGSVDDYGDDIAVDAAGNVYVTGHTRSSGWVSGGFDTSYNGHETSSGGDAFVVKLGPTGNHVWSTYLGGSGDDFGRRIAVDTAGNVYVTGYSRSSGWISGSFDTSHNGDDDAFVVKLSSSGGHLWSTFLGGSGWDGGYGIAVDAADNVYVTGDTSSDGWVSRGFQTRLNGCSDAFVVKLSSSGEPLWSTYLGGLGADYGYAIEVDLRRNVYVMGNTLSDGWVAGGFDTSRNGDYDPFVVKLSSSGDPLWSTYLGGSASDRGWGIAVDTEANVYVTGETLSDNWASGGFDTTYNGGRDAFLVKLNPAGEHRWSSYLGGSEWDASAAIAIGPESKVYVTGNTGSSGWVSDGFDTSYAGNWDAFVANISDMSDTTTYSISPNPATVNEEAGTLSFTVTRSGGLPPETIFASSTQTENYTNSSDYTGIVGQNVVFGLNQTQAMVILSITNDTAVESNETFGLIVQRNLTDPISIYLAKSTFTIIDADVTAITDQQKRQEMLSAVNAHRGAIPTELVLAVIGTEGGKGAFHVDGYRYNPEVYAPSNAPWAQPSNNAYGIMQVEWPGYQHHFPYSHTQSGYGGAIADGCGALLSEYGGARSLVGATLRYNAGPASLYTYLGRNEGTREYLSRVADTLSALVPQLYPSLANATLVGWLNQGQNVLNRYLYNMGLAPGRDAIYYATYQARLEQELRNISDDNSAPALTAIDALTGAVVGTPSIVTYAMLSSAANAADADGDPISFRIESVSSGELTKNGAVVVPGGTLLSAGESLLWTPPANAIGALDAFTVKVFDGTLASAAPVQVKVAVRSWWQNPIERADVDNNGIVTPRDALLIINELLANGSHAVPPPSPGVPTYYDVSGDGRISPLDVLHVINHLLSRSQAVVPATGPAVPTSAEVASEQPAERSEFTAMNAVAMALAADADDEHAVPFASQTDVAEFNQPSDAPVLSRLRPEIHSAAVSQLEAEANEDDEALEFDVDLLHDVATLGKNPRSSGIIPLTT